jgi:hypothetical protein
MSWKATFCAPGGRLRTLHRTAVCQFLAQSDLPAPTFVSLD